MDARAFGRRTGRLTAAGDGATEPATSVAHAGEPAAARTGSARLAGPLRKAGGGAGRIGQLTGGARRSEADARPRRIERVTLVHRETEIRSRGDDRAASAHLHLERPQAVLALGASPIVAERRRSAAELATVTLGANRSGRALRVSRGAASSVGDRPGRLARGGDTPPVLGRWRGLAGRGAHAALVRLIVADPRRAERRPVRRRRHYAATIEDGFLGAAGATAPPRSRAAGIRFRRGRRRARSATNRPDEGHPRGQGIESSAHDDPESNRRPLVSGTSSPRILNSPGQAYSILCRSHSPRAIIHAPTGGRLRGQSRPAGPAPYFR
jgi:hypothetical protein